MKRTTKYVGLDVHQASTVSSVREEGGRVIARTIVPTEASAIVEFFGGLRGTIHVAFEEGTQAQWLHDLITPLVARVFVCDQHGQRRRGNKNDLVDADELADAIQVANPFAPFEFPNEYIHNGRLPPTFYGSGFWLNSGNVMADVPEDLVVGMGAFGCDNEFFMAYSSATDIVRISS